MNKQQAFEKAAMDGSKIRHNYFTDDEYLEILPSGKIRFEDGVQCTIQQFNEDRQGPQWETGWSIIQETQF
jgi:hypothetical protein